MAISVWNHNLFLKCPELNRITDLEGTAEWASWVGMKSQFQTRFRDSDECESHTALPLTLAHDHKCMDIPKHLANKDVREMLGEKWSIILDIWKWIINLRTIPKFLVMVVKLVQPGLLCLTEIIFCTTAWAESGGVVTRGVRLEGVWLISLDHSRATANRDVKLPKSWSKPTTGTTLITMHCYRTGADWTLSWWRCPNPAFLRTGR